MPLKQDRCSECNTAETVCPECGSSFVTPRENPQHPAPQEVIDFGGVEEITYTHVCWECGWDEEVTMIVTRSG